MRPVPDFLTIPEAARVLRIGRTKAYAMALEWRVTGGKSGMKVVDIGGQYRVPKVWLEELLGAPIEFIPDPPPALEGPDPETPGGPEPPTPKGPRPPAPKTNKNGPATKDSEPPQGGNKNKKRKRRAA